MSILTENTPTRNELKRYLAVASFLFAIIFALLGILLPPIGVIDSSINLLIAQLLVLTATLIGVDSYYTRIKDLTVGKGK